MRINNVIKNEKKICFLKCRIFYSKYFGYEKHIHRTLRRFRENSIRSDFKSNFNDVNYTYIQLTKFVASIGSNIRYNLFRISSEFNQNSFSTSIIFFSSVKFKVNKRGSSESWNVICTVELKEWRQLQNMENIFVWVWRILTFCHSIWIYMSSPPFFAVQNVVWSIINDKISKWTLPNQSGKCLFKPR